MSKLKELKNKTTKEEKKTFTTSDFFKEDQSFANKQKFEQEFVKLSSYDREKIEIFFNQLSNGLKLNVSIAPTYNEEKKLKYYHVSAQSAKLNRGYKLPDIEGVTKLINIYELNTYKIDLNLEDVYDASLS
ncbi:hypothetical protein [Sphingobacterium sp. CZ-2]|uniref:hypothetical protein n=1 Tax=Sphingobacterium sp. CZ-2 TaxID=2557994 RepID=UPI0010705711|nr:hypothetical protein [Sphingobacterium sp. CZ-2]QBR10724.1 hypothetical protein E3D81_00430 [Sphingobacterium sp. CZ-2]